MELKTLDSLGVGEKGIITAINGGRTATIRLCEMGFNRGSEVCIVKNDIGPIIVGLAGSKIALGWGLANKIMVQQKEPGLQHAGAWGKGGMRLADDSISR
ncbi:MAG TPA: FeoA domain-containing protein [Clostridia bacterium]|nr:FeoA domain-containing protein [Clostridia bacterium]